MDSEELERRLEGGKETESLDVKAAMPWEAAKFAKHLLALANVRDGGYIIIGVENETFKRIGVATEIAATYKIDVMRDQMAKYADPHVDFFVSFPKDVNGLQFVVISVESFRQVPVICRTNKDGLQAGAIYYRNSDKRPQSAPISNSYDMRDLITVATSRMTQAFKGLGLGIEDVGSAAKFDAELGGL